ncbi:MAG: sigma-70 family RNA polymerase sigma factor [Methyloglobulus sp.]|nr:sigma-70 family RNA polymerase sigma factor [Methyloglobulus sp.]
MNPLVLVKQSFKGTSLNKTQDDQQLRDANLIARLCDADESALEQLYHHYYPRLFRFIARITRRDELVDEIVNEVMFVVWEKATSYDQTCKPSTWIFGIAFNKARQAVRDNSHANEEAIEDIDENNISLGKLDNGFMQLELDDWLGFALAQLTPEHRAVIELTYYQGLHYSEIATVMDCPESTVKTRMFYARKNLATLLTTPNGSSDTHTQS